jgi:hypothetical protein
MKGRLADLTFLVVFPYPCPRDECYLNNGNVQVQSQVSVLKNDNAGENAIFFMERIGRMVCPTGFERYVPTT